MELGFVELHLFPPEATKLDDPQHVAIGHEDHGRVAVTVTAAFAGGGDEEVNLPRCEIFPRPELKVGAPYRGNCPIFDGWHGVVGDWLGVEFARA